MSNPHDQKEKPSIVARVIVGLAWLVLFSSAAMFVMTTAQPELVDGVARKVLRTKN